MSRVTTDDMLYSRIQLNADVDDVLKAVNSESSTSLPELLPRELYLYAQDSRMFAYVGLPENKVAHLNAHYALQANKAATVECLDTNGNLKIYNGATYGGTFSSDYDGRMLTIAQGVISSAWTDKTIGNGIYALMTQVDIRLGPDNTIAPTTDCSGYPAMRDIAVLNVPRLTLKPGNSETRGFGYTLPSSAEYGEVFFLLSES